MARMRLRQRPPRVLGADWVQPRWSGRWTTIGNLDSPFRGLVDAAGLTTVDGAGWSLDWWIGAEDRWHLPCQEVAVRQSLLGGSPVVETRLRVPSGDAVHRAYAARSASGAEALVVEIENQSKIPFAVALAIRPHDQVTVGQIETIELEGPALLVDGDLALVLPRSPGRVALSDASRDSAALVFAGDATTVGPAAVTCRDGLAQAALLFPLAHTATLRVVLPLTAAGPVEPADFPSADQVASGWATHGGGGTRFELPDRRLRDAVAASTRHLLLGQGDAEVAAALDLVGFPSEAARVLASDPVELARSARPGAALHALGRHWELTHDVAFASAAVRVVAALVSRIDRTTDTVDRALGLAARDGVRALLAAAGEQRAADDVAALMSETASDGELGPDLGALLSSAGSTWTWSGDSTGHDLAANAALVTLVREQLVREDHDGLALSPVVPDGWLGQGWELHDAPTRHGLLSYAVRWHGDRPALLWQLAPHDDGQAVTLTIPGLDPTWSTTDPTGEALLAPVAPPERTARRGLTIPVSIEPMPGPRP
jgi:hypothetical protein